MCAANPGGAWIGKAAIAAPRSDRDNVGVTGPPQKTVAGMARENNGALTMADAQIVRILLVEDQRADARLVSETLADTAGARVQIRHAESLAIALERIVTEPFDAVLLDLSLPDAHGLEAVAAVQHAAPTLPIVVLSGLRDEALSVEAVRAGAQDYLVKGWGNGDILLRALRYAIERKRTERNLVHMAQHDSLTGLPNRALFQERLTRALEHARAARRTVGLILLDLDDFKRVNDTFGHMAGDLLLQTVAEKITGCIRSRDTVARLGGDEFALVLEEIVRPHDVTAVAEKVLQVLADGPRLKRRQFKVRASMGIALYPQDADELDTLIGNADAALYRAKAAGGGYRFHDSERASLSEAGSVHTTHTRQ